MHTYNTQDQNSDSTVSLSQFSKVLGVNKGTVYRTAKDLGIVTTYGLDPESQNRLTEYFKRNQTVSGEFVETPNDTSDGVPSTSIVKATPKTISTFIPSEIQSVVGFEVDTKALDKTIEYLDLEFEVLEGDKELENAELALLEEKARIIQAKRERNQKAKRELELTQLKNSLRAEILEEKVTGKF